MNVKTQTFLAGAMALAVVLAVSGCSGGKFLASERLFKPSSSQLAAEPKDRAARSELALARL